MPAEHLVEIRRLQRLQIAQLFLIMNPSQLPQIVRIFAANEHVPDKHGDRRQNESERKPNKQFTEFRERTQSGSKKNADHC